MSSGAGRKLVVSLKPIPISPDPRADAVGTVFEIYVQANKTSVYTIPGGPMAAHRVKFLIIFTFAVRKFFWFPPPKARDLMPISHTPLEPFVDSDAFTVIDSKTCTKIPVSVYGSPMCFHCMVSRKRMKPQRSVLLQLKYFFMLSSSP